ncbi:putative dolichyldiphosphatase [Cyphellophora attinorum]|uniref:Dolichyldiphosphatase n=1 Tax=Cyphellophora attinorum TaxID=1664694 RepID=A0A0N1H6M1_9EURO|nr:putative dolichyldiphosphatase [Phialophora attinorum]KPI37934.1 putative dolichyldiphosphatase [Phialophora attinorum]
MAGTDPPNLTSLSLTHALYDPTDPISHISAYLALTPQFFVCIYVTLIWATREVEVLLMFAGQMACEALNFVAKRLLKGVRPTEHIGKGYGMPSSHAQFAAYFCLHLTLFLVLRHQTSQQTSTSHRPTSKIERLALSILVSFVAFLVATSRIYLNYHTPLQVWTGFGIGLAFAVLWFGFTTYLRSNGWVDWALDTKLARLFRMRDLLLTEDLQDAGWGRWEERRKAGKRDAGSVPAKAIGTKKEGKKTR